MWKKDEDFVIKSVVSKGPSLRHNLSLRNQRAFMKRIMKAETQEWFARMTI